MKPFISKRSKTMKPKHTLFSIPKIILSEFTKKVVFFLIKQNKNILTKKKHVNKFYR